MIKSPRNGDAIVRVLFVYYAIPGALNFLYCTSLWR